MTSKNKRVNPESLAIFDTNKYDYTDFGRFVWIEECLALQRICFALSNTCNGLVTVHKETMFKNEDLLLDIAHSPKT